MAKIADQYFKENPWKIVEEGFDPAHAQVAESIFSLGNEYMGVRGYMEEGYSGEKLIGSYFNGIYERKREGNSSYKGIVNFTEFMVNAVNWLDTEIWAEEEKLDLAKSRFSDFNRELNMKNGLLTRSFVWNTKSGKKIRISMDRILSMKQVNMGAQKIALASEDFEGKLIVKLGLDFSGIHENARHNFWVCEEMGRRDGHLFIQAKTEQTDQQVYCEAGILGEGLEWIEDCEEEKKITAVYEIAMQPGKEYTIVRKVCNQVRRQPEEKEQFALDCQKAAELIDAADFETLTADNASWWGEIWTNCDIEITGDLANQQGIRFCIFQLFQTYHGAVKGSNIGAKGLTGEAYNGNAFWDTETYCLPFFLFNDLEGAKNLLYFRYKTLPEAKERAKALDCEGAFYPIATISGRECCNLWQHASLQLQASTAVAYGIWFYEKMTQDTGFMAECGLEMLIEISRMLASRGDYSNDGSKYGFYCVMGPDEFQMMVNHNCYTNYMGRFTFLYTIGQISQMKEEWPDEFAKVAKKVGLRQQEISEWAKMAELMYIPYDPERKLYEQNEGFFDLPHVDVDAIPVEDFPLYSHWSYDHIYRNDMIKQPDVLMLMLLFNSSFTMEELRNNYEYYEPRCIHESSLSPSVHSILASQLKKGREAYDFFGFATRMDLDNYNRNTNEGIHTTSIAAAWMNIVYGFGGLRSDGEGLSLNPTIPQEWESYSFRLHCGGDVLMILVEAENVTIQTVHGNNVPILLYGEAVTAGREAKKISIPSEWRD